MSRISRIGRTTLLHTLALAAALTISSVAGAQVPDSTQRDSARVRAMRDSIARADSIRADSASRAWQTDSVRADSLRRLRSDATVRDSATSPTAITGPVTLRASLSARELYVEQNGQVLRTYKVAVGTNAHPTPKGQYNIRKIVWNPSWHPPDEAWARKHTPKGPGHPANPMKLVKIFYREPDYYIHGTGDVRSLGTAASHGCLRMEPWQAAEVAQLVMESGGASRDWSWVKRVLHLGETKTMNLKQAVPLTITG
jgi:lipoprotein-anchoring transpeptidase ErfK/SrfK